MTLRNESLCKLAKIPNLVLFFPKLTVPLFLTSLLDYLLSFNLAASHIEYC